MICHTRDEPAVQSNHAITLPIISLARVPRDNQQKSMRASHTSILNETLAALVRQKNNK